MSFQPDPDRIMWRLHLSSSPERVYDALDSDDGRASFWAESAVEHDGVIHFEFVNRVAYAGRIVARDRPRYWTIEYFGSTVEFALADDGRGGTDLAMTDTGTPPEDRTEVIAGWLNVLLPMKAALDFGVDLHSHDPARSWHDGYVDH